MSARTSVTASASPRSRMPSASSGVSTRCTANTGVSRIAFLTVCAGYRLPGAPAPRPPPTPAGGRMGGRPGEVLDRLADLVAPRRLGRLFVVGDGGRSPRRQLRPRAVVHAAVVRELEERDRTVLVD